MLDAILSRVAPSQEWTSVFTPSSLPGAVDERLTYLEREIEAAQATIRGLQGEVSPPFVETKPARTKTHTLMITNPPPGDPRYDVDPDRIVEAFQASLEQRARAHVRVPGDSDDAQG